MKKRNSVESTVFVGILIAMLLSACASEAGPVSTEIPKGATPSDSNEKTKEPETPADAAVDELARQLGIDPKSIEVVSVSPVEWPNSCLGVPIKGVMCMDVITPGYIGILEANGIQYEFHSNQRGEQIHFIPEAVLAAQGALAQELGLNSEAVLLVSFEQVMWRDSCLGVQIPNMNCLDVITPGYRVVMQVNGDQYIYHTDESGNNLVLAESPQAENDDSIIFWSLADETGCQQALISLREVSFGKCEGPMATIPFMSGMNGIDLDYFKEKYASFEAQTAAGKINFNGVGSESATPAEQRMITEWAKLTKQVAEAGRAGAAWGLALVWHREGGIAGFCDDLTVYLTGVAQASSCKLEEPAIPERIILNADKLERLYDWVDSLSSFVYEQTDPGTADSITIYIEFVGTGEGAAIDEVRQAILDFAAEIHAQATGSQSTD
jgi:hypothetical protein